MRYMTTVNRDEERLAKYISLTTTCIRMQKLRKLWPEKTAED
jgi:hypothetical protein